MVRVHLIVKLGLSVFPFIDDACKGPMAAAIMVVRAVER